MPRTAAITVLAGRDEVERRWNTSEHGSAAIPDEATVRLATAPGDRGTEIHLTLPDKNPLAQAAQKVTGSDPRAKALDELRKFKQLVETGYVARSGGAPAGEQVEMQPKQQEAQPA